jgi:hypothetical protein
VASAVGVLLWFYPCRSKSCTTDPHAPGCVPFSPTAPPPRASDLLR